MEEGRHPDVRLGGVGGTTDGGRRRSGAGLPRRRTLDREVNRMEDEHEAHPDFARGQEKEEEHGGEKEHTGDFAEGQEDETEHDKHKHPDFARGQETGEHGDEKEHKGSFAEGQEEEDHH